MISRMKLGGRGLLLTAVPLIFQVVVVLWFGWQVRQLLVELEETNTSLNLASDVNNIIEETILGVATMHVNSETEGLIDSATTNKERRNFIISVNNLKAQKLSRDQKVAVAQFEKSVRGLVACLDAIHEHQRQGRQHWRSLDEEYYRQVSEKTMEFIDSGSKVVALEEARLANMPAVLDKRAAEITQSLLIAVPAGLLMSLLLGIIWITGIRNPLNRVIENSEHLSNREQLPPALKSGDELGQLDRLIHSVDAALTEAHQKETSLLENAADLICSLDEEFVFTKANSYSQTLLGISSADLVGQVSILDLIVSEERLKAEESFRRAQQTADTLTLELRLERGKDILDTSWSILWSDTQRSLFCVVQDVSDQKKVERLKEDFVNMVSHDLRSPLTAILGSMTLLSAGAKGPISDKLHGDVDIAKRNIERLIVFVNDLLDFQKLNAGKMEIDLKEARVADIVTEAVELVERLADEKGLEIDTACGDWVVNADHARIVQVITNFLGNAIKFSPEGSTITVDTERTQDAIEIRVTDSGPGVPEQYRDSIFEPFEQVPGAKTREGTGFGLAVCKLVADAHGARIGVRPSAIQSQGSGSTFWIALPLGRA